MGMRAKDVKNLFENHGYQVISIHRTRHWNVRASINGLTKNFAVSVSPSDCRAMKNFEAFLRRTAKEAVKESNETKVS
jgi:hypothetical protein